MKCFYHNNKDAIGICKNCSKGLCKECVTEIDKSIACKNKCEMDVKLINRMMMASMKVIEARNPYWRSIFMSGGFSIICFVFGFIFLKTKGLGLFFISMAILFFISTIFTYLLQKKSFKKESKINQ